MGKKKGKKGKAPPKPWQNEFEGLSEGMEMFWQSARDGIYQKRGEELLAQLDEVEEELKKSDGKRELVCISKGYAIIPERVAELAGLQKINFAKNLVTEDTICTDFWTSPHLATLTHLDLSSNRLQNLPDDREEHGLYKHLVNVKVLKLDNNMLVELPAELGLMTGLVEVTMCNNQLQDFREEWSNWVNLEELDISHNFISSLPNSMNKWTKLRSLRIKQCKLIGLPDTLGQCDKLEKLNISYNQLQLLPESIMCLRVLEEFDLTQNEIAVLPEQFMYLTALKKLYIGRNTLKPSSVNSICGLTKLEDLFMPKNLLTSIPKEIGNLVNLRRFSCAGNKMKSLPAEVGEWTKIEEVYLSLNDYEKLPTSIEKWTNLVELHCWKCASLSVVNERVAEPLTLLRIDLRDTQVEIPEAWGKIPPRIPPFYIVGGMKAAKGKAGAKKKK